MDEIWINQFPPAAALILTLLLLFTTWIAVKRGFFKLPEVASYGAISFWMLPLGFLFYFSLYFILFPYLKFEGLNRVATVIWLMLGSGLLMALFTLLFGKRGFLAVWNQGRRSFKEIVRSFFLGMVTYLIAFPWVALFSFLTLISLTFWLGAPPPQVDQDAIRFLKMTFADKELFIPAAFAIALFVPLAEEILFRGLLQNYLSALFPLPFSIGITSLLFALMHYSDDQGLSNIQIVGSLFLLSLFLGFLYEREKTLLAPLALHATFNLVSIAALAALT